jgi:hypothetical protein
LAIVGIVVALLQPQSAAACGPICGQVRVVGAELHDDAGIWPMRGVQLFLPQFGINGKTFRDGNYAAALADGSLTFWLDKASGYLHANLLRVFVDMPSRNTDGSLFTPTSYATLHDVAERAAQRGMRLGLVLHNSADWNMAPEEFDWLDGLLVSFGASGELERIAYISADNEINNHCTNNGGDCFDNGTTHNAQNYIDGAIAWTASFAQIVKARAPQMLVTTGISTEKIDLDNVRAAFNFFRRASDGRRLSDLIDFLSPHNYSGQAEPVIDDLRLGAGYTGVVILEEYGFPTDPVPRNPLWTEGAFRCRLGPFSPECVNTAPYFVAKSTLAITTKSYAGSVAWTLADIGEKNVSNACTKANVSSDLWTGLFAIGGAYCNGGTYSRTLGQPKATGFLVCVLHTRDVNRCDDPANPFFRVILPLVAT